MDSIRVVSKNGCSIGLESSRSYEISISVNDVLTERCAKLTLSFAQSAALNAALSTMLKGFDADLSHAVAEAQSEAAQDRLEASKAEREDN